ncbi:DUF4960 domain-containing protein [Mucilaginibacter limnophilus]|uniref:DUF4960 domain-containing protein n=1 Tax=Mucilaginibacter limnophilus TaxID=1932778 RepID=A0A437MRY6_9SPHI|nr:DUF4960 domain-containing protein [Mucilaginibacter limnophilus]RVU00419.1 DUF4960 domain-containing protein [Mucilaginibacter limnophilus]
MTIYIKHYKAFSLLMALALLWSSCKKDKNTAFDVNADVTLKSYSINNIQGEIDEKTGAITVSMPFGTDVTALTGVMQLPGGANVSPASGTELNFTGPVKYSVTNGNLYKDYTVTVKIIPPLSSFSINGVNGSINQENKSITVILPDGTDLTSLSPEISLVNGATVSPNNGAAQDFSQPVEYTVTMGGLSVAYHVTVISNSTNEYAYLGLAATRSAITDPDEKAAADWFFTNYPNADYVSFQSIETGRSLSSYKVIWWHFDAAQNLPAAALTQNVTNKLKDFRANGGNLLLTTYAARYVEALGIVPEGRGPNNAFGDFEDEKGNGGGFVEANADWGISFKGHENHPIFQGVDTYEPGKAWLLQKGTFRANHTSWWFLPEWGGYGNGATWREQTGGINLASEAWDDNLDGRVGLAEWKTGNDANVVIIAFGAYDWYSEPKNGGGSNGYISNIQKITKNAIDYLRDN